MLKSNYEFFMLNIEKSRLKVNSNCFSSLHFIFFCFSIYSNTFTIIFFISRFTQMHFLIIFYVSWFNRTHFLILSVSFLSSRLSQFSSFVIIPKILIKNPQLLDLLKLTVLLIFLCISRPKIKKSLRPKIYLLFFW